MLSIRGTYKWMLRLCAKVLPQIPLHFLSLLRKTKGGASTCGPPGLTAAQGCASLGSSRHQSSPTSSLIKHLGRAKHRSNKMDKLIKIEVKNSYGSERYYPKCNLSRMFCDIAETQTITQHIISTIRRNGYKIDDVTPKKTFENNQ